MARIAKSTEEKVVAIEAKIAKKKEEIVKLEEQKAHLLNPVSMKDVIAKAKEAGYTPKDIAKKLGLEVE